MTPEASTAFWMVIASSSEVVSGFSQRMALPALEPMKAPIAPPTRRIDPNALDSMRVAPGRGSSSAG